MEAFDLDDRHDGSVNDSDAVYTAEETSKDEGSSFFARSWAMNGPELKKIFSLAAPIVSTYLVTYSFSLIVVIAAGHLGKDDLAACLLGSMTCNVTGISVVIGLLSGMDTLCSQAFGAGNLERVGILLQRAVAIGAVFFIPINILWFFAAPLLKALGQDDDLADKAGQFTRILCAGAPALLLSEAVRRFLQNQGIVKPMLWVSLLTLPIHGLICWQLATHFGFIGLPISLALSYWMQLGGLLGYIFWMKPHDPRTWTGISIKEAFKGWKEYLRQGLPSAAMLVLEWWSFEVLALIAGTLPDGEVSLASHGVAATIVPLAFMIPLGLNAAASTRIGHLMGAACPMDAKRCAKLCLFSCEFLAVLTVTFLFTLRRQVIAIFTSDKEVADTTLGLYPFLMMFILFDFWQGASQGVVRGCGKNRLGATIVLIGNYFVSLPLAICLAKLTSMEVRGLWLGMATGYSTVLVMYSFCIYNFNWHKLSEIAVREQAENNEGLPIAKNSTNYDSDESLLEFDVTKMDRHDIGEEGTGDVRGVHDNPAKEQPSLVANTSEDLDDDASLLVQNDTRC